MRTNMREGINHTRCRKPGLVAGLVLAIAAAALLPAGNARADLGTGLQLYNSMNTITPYSPPAFWEDVSGNDHVSLANPPAYDGGGNRATAVDFVGDNGANRILVKDGAVAALEPGLDDYSVSLWYNETTAEAYNYLLTKGNSNSSDTGGYSLASVNGVPTLRINDVSNLATSPPKVTVASAGGALPTGNWHHLVAVFDRTGATYGSANQVKLYVDNVEQGSATLADIDFITRYNVSCANAAYSPLCIGGRNNSSSNDFEGYMDDVAIFRGALSVADVNTLYTAPSLTATTVTTSGITPVMVHNFVDNRNSAEVPATVPDDYDGRPGVIHNGAEKVVDTVRGEVLALEGTAGAHTEYVTYDNVPDPGTGSYTVALWCKLADAGSTSGEVLAYKGMKQSTGVEGWSLFLSQSDPLNPVIQIRGNYDGTTANRIKVIKSLPFDDQWHHVAMVIDRENGVFKGYLDGLGSGLSGAENGWAIADGNFNTIPVDADVVSPDQLILGNATSSNPANGLLDDFAIWTRALSDTEILSLFEGATFPPRPSSIPGDATGNGVVDELDAQRLATNWGASGEAVGWAQGDFNGDKVVNAADASILAANWGAHTESARAVPEPATFAGLAGLIALAALARRRR